MTPDRSIPLALEIFALVKVREVVPVVFAHYGRWTLGQSVVKALLKNAGRVLEEKVKLTDRHVLQRLVCSPHDLEDVLEGQLVLASQDCWKLLKRRQELCKLGVTSSQIEHCV